MIDHPGRRLLTSLKAVTGRDGPCLVLPVGSPVCALLRPAGVSPGALNRADIRRLTEWRNRFVQSFLTEFVATDEQTASWLVNVVGPSDDRLLFMIDDLQGRTFGYIGLAFIDWEAGYGEADAVVRGGDAPRGTMSEALATLLDWARHQLGIGFLGVRVRSDNSALDFYSKCGFVETRRVPLVRTEEPGKVIWREQPDAGESPVSLVHMIWKPGQP